MSKYRPEFDLFYPTPERSDWGIYRDSGYGRYPKTRDFFPAGTSEASVEFVNASVTVSREYVEQSMQSLERHIWRQFSTKHTSSDGSVTSSLHRELVGSQLLMFFAEEEHEDHTITRMKKPETLTRPQGRYQLLMPENLVQYLLNGRYLEIYDERG